MNAYYNEHDRFAAAWLRELMRDGLIAPGVVDERSIVDVQPSDLAGFDRCHFFAGIGGWDYALQFAGWGDRPVWTGSCPCQPYSAAGKNEGAADPRNLWPAWFRLIRECRPDTIFGEQVEAAIRHGWLDAVSADLEAEGYAIGAAVLGAHSVGAQHIRQRLFFVAHANREGLPLGHGIGNPAQAERPPAWSEFERVHAAGDWAAWSSESGAGVFVDGLPNRVGTLRGAGNAIVPQAAAEFIRAFLEVEV